MSKKIRNKKTGKIIELQELLTDEFLLDLFSKDYNYFISKLNKIVEEWEAYEEPTEYWYIDLDGEVCVDDRDDIVTDTVKEMREIGNYFETKEEAEKAVEKLKAWKRLKNKGFRFTGVGGVSNYIFVSFKADEKYNSGHIMFDEYSSTDNNLKEYNKDLTLLFGSEND